MLGFTEDLLSGDCEGFGLADELAELVTVGVGLELPIDTVVGVVQLDTKNIDNKLILKRFFVHLDS